MGTSRLADALTGLSIPNDEPVVALVIERRTGGYPDATTHAAMAPHSPSNTFEPISLPIHGKAGDYQDFEPAKGDLGAALLMDLAAKKNWKDFSEAAFGYKGAIVLGLAARGEKTKWSSPEEDAPRALGIVAFRKSSWDRVVELGSVTLDRKGDVKAVVDAIASVRAATAAGDNDVMAMNMNLLDLTGSYLYARDANEKDGISSTHLPALARAFQGREGGDLVSGTATSWIRRNSGIVGYRNAHNAPDPRLPKLLGLAWDLQAAERGMGVLCKTWQPSYGAGQGSNFVEVAETALATFADSAGHMLDRLEGGWSDGERAAPKLEAMLARIEELRESLATRLAEARAEDAPSP